ncbi:MAG: AsmA family protein, partial [Pseudomonadota bacterium]
MAKRSISFARRHMGRLGRFTLESLLLLVIAGALLLLYLRYEVLPEIETYHAEITAAASAAIGQPLTIGRIAADWDGLRPRLSFTDVQILDAQGKVALSLPRIENTVAWTSLPMIELRFHSLAIDSPDLSVRRDALGKWYVAGIALDPSATTEQGSPDWLLHQSSVVIRNGRITWQDDLRAAPPLALEQVELRIENRGRHHLFAVSALPPERLSSRLDVRGNFYGASFADMSDWRGELYTQFDYVDVPAWKTWVTMPAAFRRGKGALRMWLGFERGKVHGVDADVALAGVRARLSESLPPLDLSELRGRIGWQDIDRGFEFFAQKLALKMRDGFKLAPTDFYLRLAGKQDEANASGEIRLNAVELGDLKVLASYLPIDEGLKAKYSAAEAKGKIAALRASWEGPTCAWRRCGNTAIRATRNGRSSGATATGRCAS